MVRALDSHSPLTVAAVVVAQRSLLGLEVGILPVAGVDTVGIAVAAEVRCNYSCSRAWEFAVEGIQSA